MKLPWILGIFLSLRVAVPTEVVNLGPPTGIVLQEIPGLLITRCSVYTQRVYVRLDPWDVYRKHIRLPPRLTEGRLSGTQTHDTVEHAKQTTIHILEQLQKFLVTEKNLSGEKRPKRFLGGLFTAVSAIGSLFSIGLSAANSVSIKALQRHMGELSEEMPEIQQRLLIQREQLQDLGKTLQGTIVTVNLHSALLNNTLHALGTLSEVIRDDFMYVRVVRDLMQDLLREVSSSVSSLSGGQIPTYLVPMSLVEQTLRSATTTVVQSSQAHLAYSLGSAIPVYVNPQNLEIGFLLNLPIIEQQNVYRLKSVLNVGFWRDNTHVHLKTPPTLAYHDDDPSLYLSPNLNLCTKTKDVHWVCPGNPFIRDVSNYLCGLRAESPEQKCQGRLSIKDEGMETKVERAGNRWLVSTPVNEALMAYDRHDTTTKVTLPNQTMFLTVPQGATIHFGDIVLHHLNSDQHDTEIEIMDAFRGHNVTIDDTLQQQLLAEGTKVVKFSLKPSGLTTAYSSHKSLPYQEHHVSWAALGLLLSGWIITAVIAHIMYKYIRRLQARLDTLLVVPQRFVNRSASAPRTNTIPFQE